MTRPALRAMAIAGGLLLVGAAVALAGEAGAAAGEGPRLTLELGGLEEPGGLAAPLKLALIATAVGLAPAFVAIMATSFTRLIIVLHFVRQALGTQSMPPNQVLAGLALFLTFFVMMPVATQVSRPPSFPTSRASWPPARPWRRRGRL